MACHTLTSRNWQVFIPRRGDNSNVSGGLAFGDGVGLPRYVPSQLQTNTSSIHCMCFQHSDIRPKGKGTHVVPPALHHNAYIQS